MSEPFQYFLRVRYGECDAQQVAFNARYGDYVDIAANEFMRALWGDYANLLAQGLDLQVPHYAIDWQAPARFDEVLAVAVTCERVGTTSFTLRCDFRAVEDGREIASARIVYVLFRPGSGEKCPLPAEMRECLQTGAPGRWVDHAGRAGIQGASS